MVSFTLSTPVKIFVLVAVVALFGFMGSMMFMGPKDDASLDEPIVLPKKKSSVLDAVPAATKVAKKADAAAKRTAAATAPAPSAPAAKKAAAAPAAQPAPKAKPKPKPVSSYHGVASNGLPMQLVVALERHDVVVVSIWGTGGKIDEMARDEAAAGAAVAGAGFVAINVIDRSREAEALTLELGVVLRAPSVLYFTKPDALVNRLDGFRDRETVAQAALDARR